MDKCMKMKVCECCDKKFFVHPNENWKTLCKKWFIDCYLPLRSKFKQSELKGHWKSVKSRFEIKAKIDKILNLREIEANRGELQPYWTGSEYDYR